MFFSRKPIDVYQGLEYVCLMFIVYVCMVFCDIIQFIDCLYWLCIVIFNLYIVSERSLCLCICGLLFVRCVICVMADVLIVCVVSIGVIGVHYWLGSVCYRTEKFGVLCCFL